MADPYMFSADELDTLRRGGTVTIGGAVYRLCFNCQCVVKMNKVLFGSVHICEEGE